MSYNWLFHAASDHIQQFSIELMVSTKIESIEALRETSESAVDMK